jgi:hypothetical protein
MIHSRRTWICFAAALCACTQERSVSQKQNHVPPLHAEVAQSPLGEAEKLVAALKSPTPPPHPDNYWGASIDELDGFESPAVAAASARLVSLGPVVFPVLMRHRDDREYSYSSDSATWLNHSVGRRAQEILEHDLVPCGGGYPSAKVVERDTPLGRRSQPNTYEYFEKVGLEAWAKESTNLSREEVHRRYVRWYMGIERSRGFVNKKQEHEVLDECLRELAEPPN